MGKQRNHTNLQRQVSLAYRVFEMESQGHGERGCQESVKFEIVLCTMNKGISKWRSSTSTSNDLNVSIIGDANLYGLGHITHPGTMKNAKSKQKLLLMSDATTHLGKRRRKDKLQPGVAFLNKLHREECIWVGALEVDEEGYNTN